MSVVFSACLAVLLLAIFGPARTLREETPLRMIVYSPGHMALITASIREHHHWPY